MSSARSTNARTSGFSSSERQTRRVATFGPFVNGTVTTPGWARPHAIVAGTVGVKVRAARKRLIEDVGNPQFVVPAESMADGQASGSSRW
jgi:hypothetical protein